MESPQFKNSQLQFDLEKILSYDDWCYTDITTDFSNGLGFILDIKDNSYFYLNKSDRDLDDSLIIEVLKDKFLF